MTTGLCLRRSASTSMYENLSTIESLTSRSVARDSPHAPWKWWTRNICCHCFADARAKIKFWPERNKLHDCRKYFPQNPVGPAWAVQRRPHRRMLLRDNAWPKILNKISIPTNETNYISPSFVAWKIRTSTVLAWGIISSRVRTWSECRKSVCVSSSSTFCFSSFAFDVICFDVGTTLGDEKTSTGKDFRVSKNYKQSGLYSWVL